MRQVFLWLLTAGITSLASDARADGASAPVIYEGKVGPYEARITVRSPEVIPGLAEISIRVLQGEITEANALPIKWNTGRKGAPPPDTARPVRGETNLYSTQLWFMESGAHGIEVNLRGPAGEGRVLVPINSLARRVLTLPRTLGTLLAFLGTTLVVLFVSIAGAAVREAQLAPGAIPSPKRRRGARGAVAAALVFASLALWGGWEWWSAEASAYRNNRLYRPMPTRASVEGSSSGARLQLVFEEVDPRRVAPLVPDHGRLMHLFMIREPQLDAMAHLHPVRVNRDLFTTPLPNLPAGAYALYAQVTYETGLAQTFTNHVSVPSFPANSARLDPEDGWWTAPGVIDASTGSSTARTALGDGLWMEWWTTEPLVRRSPASLRLRVSDEGGALAPLEPYLGMLGHLVVRSFDGRVFSHLHPSGSFSMAAQQLFELRDAGKAPLRVQFGANDPTCQLPSVEESAETWLAQKPLEPSGELSFPYEFPESGSFRVWVQVRARGKVRTGAFDLRVQEAP